MAHAVYNLVKFVDSALLVVLEMEVSDLFAWFVILEELEFAG